MFCIKCGQQIPDGSVFCPNCGASIVNSAAQQPQQAEQHVQQFAQQPQQAAQQAEQQAQQFAQQPQQAAQQTAQQVQQFAQQPQQAAQQTAQQVQQFAQQPQQAEQHVQQFAQQAQQFAQQPQQLAQQAQQFAQQPQQFAQQPQQFAQQPQQFAQQSQQYAQQPQQYAQQPQQYAQQPQQYAQQPQQYVQQPQQPVYNAANVMMPKPKKSKKGLAIGLGAGGVAVATAAAVTFFVVKPQNSPGWRRTFEGDQGFAKSVQNTYIDGFMDEGKSYTGLFANAGQIYGKIAKRQKATMTNYDSYSSLKEKYDSGRLSMASALYSYVDMIDQPDDKNMTIAVSVNAEMGDSLKSLLKDYIPNFSAYEEQINNVIGGINGLELKVAQSAADDGYSLYLCASGGGSEIGGIVMNLKKSGELKVSFPGIIDGVFTAQIPSYDEMGLGEVTEATAEAVPQIDGEKIDELARKITDAYYSCYEFADVKYSDAEISFGSETEKCTVITVTMDGKAIVKIFERVADVIDSESYVDELITAFGLDGSFKGDVNAKAQITESIRNAAKSFEAALESAPEGTEPPVKLITENYVNGNSVCLGSKFRLYMSGTEYFRLESIDNDKYMETRLSICDQKSGQLCQLLTISGNHTETSGDFDIVADMSYFGSAFSGKKIGINLSYTDKKKFTAFGQEMLGGSYKIKFSDASMFEGMVDSKIYDVIKNAEITLSLLENDGGIKCSFGVSAGSYGSVGLNYSMVPKAEIPAINGSRTIDLNNIGDEESQKLGQEIMAALQSKAESNSAIKALMDMVAAPMMGYVDSSKITAADSTASSLKDSFNTFLTDMDTKNAGVKRSTDTYEFRIDVSDSDVAFTTEYAKQALSKGALEYNGGSDGDEWLDAFAEKIKEDYDFTDATAWLYLRNGMCVGVAYYGDYAGYYFEHPHGYDFEKGFYNWADTPGLTAGDDIIGTCPKLADDDNWDNDAYQNYLPKIVTNTELSGIYEVDDNSGYLVFEGDKITVVFAEGGTTEGTYTIEDDTLTVNLNGRDVDYDIDIYDDYILIDGDKYYKRSTAPNYSNDDDDNGNSGLSAPLNGKYVATDDDAYFTFDGDKVSYTIQGYTLGGTYSISNGNLHITFIVYDTPLDYDYKFSQSGDSIFIEGQEYKHTS